MVKLIRFMIAFLFAFVFVMAMGSAALSVTSSVSFTNPESEKSIILSNTNSSLNFTFSSPVTFSIIGPTGAISFVAEGSTSLNGSNTTSWTIRNTTNIDYSNFKLGSAYSGNFNITGIEYSINSTDNSTITQTVLKEVSVSLGTGYCKYGVKGNLFEITGLEDDDDFEWAPLMDIEIEVEVENNDDSSKRVVVKLGLYDLTNNRFVEFVGGEDELDETIRIEEDDEEVFVFNFKLPADIDPDSDYKLYVKAYENGEEDTQCTSAIEENIDIESDEEVLMDELDFSSSVFSCGTTNTISFKVYNVGLGDEEEMRVSIYSQELSLDMDSEQFELDEGEDEEVYFDFVIPEGKEPKNYKFSVTVEYDYRESTDSFRDSESLGTYTIRVDGDKCKAMILPTITATLDSETETMVGKDLVVRLSIKNPLASTSFIMALEGYETWASSATLDLTKFNLEKDGTKAVTATFIPTKAGTQEFIVKAIYGGNVIEQKVIVSVEGSSSWISRVSEAVKGNLTFYLTLAIFLVLILIIIILLVRFVNSRRE